MIVTKLFPFRESNELIIHINSFEWEFQEFGPVKLIFGCEYVSCQYVASGSQATQAVLKLMLDDSRYASVAEVAEKYAGFDGLVQVRRSE